MKLGGLFSGVGGFELAWTQLGHEVAWMCEWDAKARKVLEARFPGVPIYPDVRDLDPAEVEAVDVMTGGSPCQGFSIAGSRSGMEHSESQLFADYVRIMDGLAERGLQYAVWENVPGVLSIKNDDGERTFAHVIGALVGAGEPVRLDPKRKWNVGLAANAERAVAWRVLDSRYFGVAQRRRRVFACVAFGDFAADRAGRTLLAVGEGVRGDTGQGGASRQGTSRSLAEGAHRPGEPIAFDWQMHSNAGTLPSTERTPALSANKTPAVLMTMREGKPGGGKGPLLAEEQSLTLATGNGQTLFQPDTQDYGVRRLTPVECERLQSFPDGWTEPAVSDSARYKAMGNAVTVNVVRWILGRLP